MKQTIKDALVSFGLQNAPVFEYEITDSTNTRAKLFANSRAAEERTPAIFVSRAQSAGRGTRGRAFESPLGGGLYLSILIYPELSAPDATGITALAAVGCCRALDKLLGDEVVGIKWVNDIYSGEKKLAGILTEGAVDTVGRQKYAVIGIGINLCDAEHSDEVREIMTSVEELGFEIDPAELAAEICKQIFELLPTVGTESLRAEYKGRSVILGKQIEIRTCEGIFSEIAVDFDEKLSLVTESSDGKIKKYVSGDVSVRPRKENICHSE